MARDTWDAARELGKSLQFPVGPYEARVPTPAEMNAVLPYIVDRAARFFADKYYCENAEVTLSHVLGINVPRQGFPTSDGYSRHGLDWGGYSKDGYDRDGYDRNGFSRYNLDREGYDRNGYDRNGYDRAGFNARGRDYNNRTREEGVKLLVEGWSDNFAAVMAAHLAALNAPVEEAAAPAKATKRAVKKAAAPAKKAATPKKAAAKKVPPKKVPAPAVKAAPKQAVRQRVLAA